MQDQDISEQLYFVRKKGYIFCCHSLRDMHDCLLNGYYSIYDEVSMDVGDTWEDIHSVPELIPLDMLTRFNLKGVIE